jgi:hypothetical protein
MSSEAILTSRANLSLSQFSHVMNKSSLTYTPATIELYATIEPINIFLPVLLWLLLACFCLWPARRGELAMVARVFSR